MVETPLRNYVSAKRRLTLSKLFNRYTISAVNKLLYIFRKQGLRPIHCVHTAAFTFVNTGVLHGTTVIYGMLSDLLLICCFYFIIKLFNVCDAQFDPG